MAYENVNVVKLSNAFDKIDNLTCKKVTELKHKIMDNESNWKSTGRNKIKSAIEELEKAHSSLLNDISKYRKICDYIKEYQELEDSKKEYENKLTRKKQELNSIGNEDSYRKTSVNNEISDCRLRIDNKSKRMSELKNNINNLF